MTMEGTERREGKGQSEAREQWCHCDLCARLKGSRGTDGQRVRGVLASSCNRLLCMHRRCAVCYVSLSPLCCALCSGNNERGVTSGEQDGYTMKHTFN